MTVKQKVRAKAKADQLSLLGLYKIPGDTNRRPEGLPSANPSFGAEAMNTITLNVNLRT